MSDLGWYGRTWYDRRQNDELDSLSARLEYQRTEARRLTAQISQVQGNLEHRLTRLTTAFDAFVELSDLREQLRAFHAEAAARQRARRTLRQLLAGRPVGRSAERPDAVDDTPGYWLPSALAGLVASVAGDTVAAEADLAAARECDPLRTDLFLCLGLLLADRLEPATVLLRRLLDLRADRPVIRAQRELWLAAVAGRFGPAGRAAVADGLAALVAGLDDDARTAAVADWRRLVDGLHVDASFATGFRQRAEPPAGLVAPILAARRLGALADWHATAVAAPEAEPGPETESEAATPAAPTAAPTTAEDGDTDPLAAILWELADEGAPDERPLLVRVAELRRVIETNGGEGAPAPYRWAAELDPPLALVGADARAKDPARRAVAVRAVAPLLATVADELRAAASEPVPERSEVQVGRQKVRYGAMGADPASVAAARAATLGDPSPPDAGSSPVGWGLVVGGVVALVLGVVIAGPGLGVTLGVLVGGGGVWTLVHARRALEAERYTQRRRESEWARVEQQIGEVATAVTDLHAKARGASEDAAVARTRIDQQIALTAAP